MAYHCQSEFNHKAGVTTHECVLRLNVFKNVQYESLKSVFMTLTWMIDRPYKQQSLLDLVTRPLVVPIGKYTMFVLHSVWGHGNPGTYPSIPGKHPRHTRRYKHTRHRKIL